MLITWIDTDGRDRTLDVERPWAMAAALVVKDDLGGRHVRLNGEAVTGECKPHHRKLWESWERGEHLEGGDR